MKPAQKKFSLNRAASKNKFLSILLAALIVLVFSLLGCATTIKSYDSKGDKLSVAVLPDLDRAKPISVSVISSEKSDESEGVKDMLKNELMKQLKAAGYTVDSVASQSLGVNIIHLRTVGGFSRFMLGPLAGKAEVNIACDLTTPQKSASFRLNTSAIDWSGFAGTTADTVKKVAGRVVQIVEKNPKK